MMTQRIHSFDIAKGILILLLPIHHYMSAMRKLGMSADFDWIIRDWQFVFTCFFMPAFFIISGYCSNFEKEQRVFWKGILKGLIVPYLTFTFFEFTLVETCIPDIIIHGDFDSLISRFADTETHCNLWFLYALLGSKTIVYYLKRHIKKDYYQQGICLSLLCIGLLCHWLLPDYNILAIYHSFIASFFILFGNTMKTNGRIYTKLKRLSIYIFLITLLIIKILGKSVPFFTAGICVGPFNFPFFIILSIFGTLSTIKLSEYIDKSLVLEYAGKNSLVIYGLHFIPLYQFLPALFSTTNANESPCNFITFILLLYIIEYLYCYLIAYIFSRTKVKKLIGK